VRLFSLVPLVWESNPIQGDESVFLNVLSPRPGDEQPANDGRHALAHARRPARAFVVVAAATIFAVCELLFAPAVYRAPLAALVRFASLLGLDERKHGLRPRVSPLSARVSAVYGIAARCRRFCVTALSRAPPRARGHHGARAMDGNAIGRRLSTHMRTAQDADGSGVAADSKDRLRRNLCPFRGP